MTGSTRPFRGHVRGFTLLELVLVMLILATVLALAGPSLRGFFASRQAQDAAAQILALTQWARSQAVSEARPVHLNFNDQEGSYWLTIQQAGRFERLDTEFGRTFFLPQGTRLEFEDLEPAEGEIESDATVTFSPQAAATPGTIRLISRRGAVVELVCRTALEGFSVEVLDRDEAQRAG